MASSYDPTRRALGDVFGNPDYVRGWTDAKRKALATIKRSEKRPPAVGGVPLDAEPLFERHLYCRACEQHIWVRAPDGIYIDALCCNCDVRFAQRGRSEVATRWMGDPLMYGQGPRDLAPSELPSLGRKMSEEYLDARKAEVDALPESVFSHASQVRETPK